MDFENGVLRGVFGLESDGVTGEWIATYSEELSDRYLLTYLLHGAESFLRT
jgi:hypothetical protein